jgi:hypothetical protein
MVEVDLRVPVTKGKRDYKRATGFFALTCPTGCQIGDDVTKIKPRSKRNSAFVGEGIEVGHVAFNRVDVRLDVADGHAKISRWVVESGDLAIDVAGEVTLDSDRDRSQIDACIRFKPTAALQARDPKTHAAVSLMGATMDEQGSNIKLRDRLAHRRCSRSPADRAAKPSARPSETSGRRRSSAPTCRAS